jgi:hypothetical protein
MKRIEKISDEAIKMVTLPIRLGIGVINAITTHMPDKLEFPYELKRKDVDHGTDKERPQEQN